MVFGTVLISYDLSRGPCIGLSDPIGNLNWLMSALGPSLAALNISKKAIIQSDAEDGIPLSFLYGDAKPSISSWASLHSAETLPRSATERLGKIIRKHSVADSTIMLGFGLPPSYQRALDRYGIPYIDLEIYPIRFGADLYLRARTNDKRLYRVLLQYEKCREDFFVDAGLSLGQSTVFGGGKRFGDCAEVALFAGQSAVDAALIVNGKLTRVEQHLASISKIARKYDYLFVRPHPYEKRKDHLDTILERIPNSVLVSDPTYALLQEQCIKAVVSLSSSVLEESEFFNKKAIKIIDPDSSAHHMNFIIGNDCCIGVEIFSTSFWRDAFSVLSSGDFISKNKIGFSAGALRSSYGRAWGVENSSRLGPLPQLSSGEKIKPESSPEFSNALLSGWNSPEAIGVWSNNERAYFGFLVEPKVSTVRITVSDGISEWRPGTKFWFRACGSSEAIYECFLTTERAVFEFSREKNSDLFVVEFGCSNSMVPLEFGFEPLESRRLGMLLHEIEVI